MALLEPGEAANAYKANILRYQAGADFLALQAAAPERLASLTGGLSAEELARRPAPDSRRGRDVRGTRRLVGGHVYVHDLYDSGLLPHVKREFCPTLRCCDPALASRLE